MTRASLRRLVIISTPFLTFAPVASLRGGVECAWRRACRGLRRALLCWRAGGCLSLQAGQFLNRLAVAFSGFGFRLSCGFVGFLGHARDDGGGDV